MKKITLFVCAVGMGALSFAQSSICPSSFKRDNGNGPCPAGRITFQFATCPNPPLTIDSIYANGVKQSVTVSSQSCSNGKAVYCITGGNLAPAGSLQVYFSQGGVPGTGYNCFVPSGGPLPVSLSAFNAKRAGNSVILNWNTENEVNAKEFTLQRKVGDAFLDIASIPATNNTNGSKYSFTDVNAAKAISQYRLKIVDQDGSFKNSDIRIVKGVNAASDFIVFPNPSSGNAKVTVSDISEPTDIQVIDNSGRVVKVYSMMSGNTVDLNGLQKGMYMIRVINKQSGESSTKKLTVVN